MGSCCSVTTPAVAHRISTPKGASTRKSSPRRRLSADANSGRRTSAQRQSSASLRPGSASASAGHANGSKTVLLDDPQNGSHSTGALVTFSPTTIPEDKALGNIFSESGAPGESAISEPSPLTFRNLELHASLSSTAVVPVSLPQDELYSHVQLQQVAICPAREDVLHDDAGQQDELHSDADERRVKTYSTRHSGQSSVVSAQQINATFGGFDVVELGFDDDDGEEPLPAFQPLQMPSHLWPVSS